MPTTLVGHREFQASSVISVVFTSTVASHMLRLPHATRVRSGGMQLSYGRPSWSSPRELMFATRHRQQQPLASDQDPCRRIGIVTTVVTAAEAQRCERTAALLIRPPSFPAKSRSSVCAAASTLLGLLISTATAARRSGWPVSSASRASASSAVQPQICVSRQCCNSPVRSELIDHEEGAGQLMRKLRATS